MALDAIIPITSPIVSVVAKTCVMSSEIGANKVDEMVAAQMSVLASRPA